MPPSAKQFAEDHLERTGVISAPIIERKTDATSSEAWEIIGELESEGKIEERPYSFMYDKANR